MNRIWVVDDKIPVHLLGGAGPLPLRFEADVVRHLVDNVEAKEWEEPRVLELCRELCGGDYSPTFFTSPEQMLRALDQDAAPPHAVIFDWDYPGSNENANRTALDRLLTGSFVYAQIYTHFGAAAVEPHVNDLRERFNGRLLPAKGKMDVTAAQLRQDIKQAWEGNMGGEVADRVRREAFRAIERTLIDIGGIPKSVLTAMTERTVENLIDLVLAKVRDELGGAGFETFGEVFSGSQSAESTEAARRLLSVWYYYFPADDRVRPGDLIELDTSGNLGFIVTPVCDLASFPKKAGRRLTWLRTVRLDVDGLTALKDAGIKLDDVGGSIIAGHGRAGDTVILLPNVPLKSGNRDTFADYAVLCHAWDNHLLGKAPDGALRYKDITPLARRCTLAAPYASGIIAKIMTVISSPGTPDLPKGEQARLKKVVTQVKAPAAAAPAGTAGAAAAPPTATGNADSRAEATVPAPEAPAPAGTAGIESTSPATGGTASATAPPAVGDSEPQTGIAEAPATQGAAPTGVTDTAAAPVKADSQNDKGTP